MSSCISAIGIANPAFRFKQQKLFEFIADLSDLDAASRARLKTIYDHSGIAFRYSVIPDFGMNDPADFKFFPKTGSLKTDVSTGKRMIWYQREAVIMATLAARNCLSAFPDNAIQQITHIITVSCTGMYAPGLDIDLIEQLDLKINTERTSINFMGCYGVINGLKVADYICRANSSNKVLLVSAELCTLHIQKGNSIDNQVANALFSDGAAAALVENISNKILPGPSLELRHFYNEIVPAARNDMRWYIGDKGFEMMLTSNVSKQIESNIRAITTRLLNNAGLTGIDAIDSFAIHPGGPKILEAVEKALELPKSSNYLAYEVLAQYGNMSSATILFVLQKILNNIDGKDLKILSFGFGPGLTVEGMVLKTDIK